MVDVAAFFKLHAEAMHTRRQSKSGDFFFIYTTSKTTFKKKKETFKNDRKERSPKASFKGNPLATKPTKRKQSP